MTQPASSDSGPWNTVGLLSWALAQSIPYKGEVMTARQKNSYHHFPDQNHILM
jgi:hypothetical protein